MSIGPALAALLDTLTRLHSRLPPWLAAGIDRAEIDARLDGLSLRLADEVYDYFGWRDGLRTTREADGVRTTRDADYELFPGFTMLSFEEALADYRLLVDAAARFAQAGVPAGSLWNERWFPLFRDAGGEYHVTLTDARPAHTAPVYMVVREDPEAAYLAYDSLTSLIQTVADCFDTGAFRAVEGGIVEEDRSRAATIVGGHNPERRRQAGEMASIEALVRTLRDTDGDARGRAAQALMTLRDPRAVPLLTEALRDDDEGVRYLVARILGELGDPGATDVLIAALDDPDPATVKEVVTALGSLKAQAAVDGLIGALGSRDGGVARAAAWALGELKASTAVTALIEALHDQTGAMRAVAAKALGDIKDPRAVQPLIDALGDRFVDVRVNAAWALGESRDARATEALSALLNDADPTVRRLAGQSLKKLPR
jgi:HEAT repeat protein